MVVTDYKRYQYGVIFRGAPHIEQQLSPRECRELMKYYKGWFIRNLYDFDCKDKTSFWFVINDKTLAISDLPSKARNQVRRALNTLDIRFATKAEILAKGYEVYLTSYKRYKEVIEPPKNEEVWKNIVSSSAAEYWGAFEKETGKLVAYAEVLSQSNMAKYTALKGIPEYLNKYYPFYGLLFVMNEYYIDQQHFFYVTDGARSVTEHSNVQVFLDKFKFRKAYCKLNIQYVWWLKMLIYICYPIKKFVPMKKMRYLLVFEAMRRNQI